MTAPNPSTLWGQVIVDEVVKGGCTTAVISPGSRSTPLVVAAAKDPDMETVVHPDERSAAFFALGRGKRLGEPTVLVSTSGTAAANYHPAVIEASHGRTPLLVLTADRPPELRDSGANQTIDQVDLYGDAPRFARDLPEPSPAPRKLRSLRTVVARAVAKTTQTPPGPVHLNIPLEKPLAPEESEAIPETLAHDHPLAVNGRDGPFVSVSKGSGTLGSTGEEFDDLVRQIERAERGLIVAGPTDRPSPPQAIVAIARATGFPVLADPLSGLRFGDHVGDIPVVGSYDGFLGSERVAGWPSPDLVLRFGASPTSKALRHYLRDHAANQVLVDPAGEWREATFTAERLLAVDPGGLAAAITERTDREGREGWHRLWNEASGIQWAILEEDPDPPREGDVLRTVAALAPDPSTLFVSNSMPVRDLDRFVEPRAAALTVLGNRGASGIDGIISTAFGAGSVTQDPLVLVLGDLAFLHDRNGLLALDQLGDDVTVVVINNDGGGIFHKLPIEDYDPPFTAYFKTPHGRTLEDMDLPDRFEHEAIEQDGQFAPALERALGTDVPSILEVRVDAERSHRRREALEAAVAERLPG
ncbi:MAG: 2-succinyl-5-enolpyruvyl-6-hydroxy-3-cyclohexene-1-carboxylic-acid synthase [Halodesulfurarchaeum sp.]